MNFVVRKFWLQFASIEIWKLKLYLSWRVKIFVATTVSTFLLQNFFHVQHIFNFSKSICLHLTDCHKSAKVSWILNNLSDFNKIAKQLMDDGKQKKHFSSKIQKVCSNPILAQTLPNSAQVLSWTYYFIINWLRWWNLLKGSR